jgi:hypothetical protein
MRITREQKAIIKTATWTRLVRIHCKKADNKMLRRAIEAEARKCGYDWRTIVALHA